MRINELNLIEISRIKTRLIGIGLLILFPLLLLSQTPTASLKMFSGDITSQKSRILLLSNQTADETLQPIDTELTSLLASSLTELGRADVIDRTNLELILNEQYLQLSGFLLDSQIVELGNIASASEAMLVNTISFSQKGVPPDNDSDEDEDESFLSELLGGLVRSVVNSITDPTYENNIQTQISIQFKHINIETGALLHSFHLSSTFTGGRRATSKSAVLRHLQAQIMQKLKTVFNYQALVVSVDDGELILNVGSNVGLRKGTIFEIRQPDSLGEFNGQKFTVPGRSVAFVSVSEMSPETNRANIRRQWRGIRPGYEAIENQALISGLLLYFLPSTGSFQGVGADGHFKPFDGFDYGLGLRYTNIIDSYEDHNNSFGLSLFGSYHLFGGQKFQSSSRVGIDWDMPSKRDDADHSVTSHVVSMTLGLTGEIFLSKKADLCIQIGYRFAGISDKWEYNKEEDGETKFHAAIWNEPAPKIDISGIYLTVGIKTFFVAGKLLR